MKSLITSNSNMLDFSLIFTKKQMGDTYER
jgi:hypothetical protein